MLTALVLPQQQLPPQPDRVVQYHIKLWANAVIRSTEINLYINQ